MSTKHLRFEVMLLLGVTLKDKLKTCIPENAAND